MHAPLLQTVYKNNFKIVFTDFFDTLIHRSKHPNYCLKLWAKFLKRELGLTISTGDLFEIRQGSLGYLATKQSCDSLEISYSELQREIYNRLRNTGTLREELEFSDFSTCFELADFDAEIGLQRVNEPFRSQLFDLAKQGVRIFLVSDTNLSKSMIGKMLSFHEMGDLFENVYVSSEVQKSKYVGELYAYIIKANQLNAKDVVMVGDNKRSDVVNAAKYGIYGLHLPNSTIKLKNKFQLFGSERKDFEKICDAVVKKCRKSDVVFSEYLIHYFFFVKRIYDHAKRNHIQDLFFLAREGLFLKDVFDDYQELNGLFHETKIRTHYLKISRQASIQISLKPLAKEKFKVLKKNNQNLSINQFLDNFNVSEDVRRQIGKEMHADLDEVLQQFFESEVFSGLLKNPTFALFYEQNRTDQKRAFDAYLQSFNSDIRTKGMTLVDIGWGGTMQESLYNYFNGEVVVTGLYLGIKEIYTIEYRTKRFGLNFSIYPSKGFDDDILLANRQLYEQLAAAPHGCTIGYSLDKQRPTVEFHEEQEKYVYENFMGDIQAFMKSEMTVLSQKLKYVDYTWEMSQNYMVKLALKTGCFMNKRKLKFIHQISKGFFQNIGNNKVGLNYESNALPFSKKTLIVKLLVKPEKLFRYIVKVQPRLYEKGLYPLSFLVNLFYYYVIIHRLFKKRIFPKNLI